MKNKLRKSGKGEESDERTSLEQKWKGRLLRMKRFRDKNSSTWERNYKLLFGQTAHTDGATDDKENEFPYGWGLVKGLETTIYVQNPEMMVEPFDSSKMELGKMLTAISNYDMDVGQMNIKEIGNLGLIDVFVNGFAAFIECVETKTSKREDKDSEGKTEEVDAPDYQYYYMRRIDPKDILFCEKGQLIDLSDMPYLSIATYPTVTEVKENPIYTDVPEDIDTFPEASAAKPPASRDAAKSGEASPTRSDEKDPDFKTICIWEIWDKTNQKVLYMTDSQDKILNPKDGGMDWKVKLQFGPRTLFPVTLMAFHPMPRGFYPKPEISLIANKLDKLNRLDQMIYQDALEKWRKYVAIGGIFTTDQLAKITDMSIPNALIEADEEEFKTLAQMPNNRLGGINDLIAPLQDPVVKKDVLMVREMCKQEITDILGYGPPERAGMPKSRSAREAMAMKERLDQRVAKRMDAVADMYRGVGMKHLKFLQQTMVVERYARVFEFAKNLTDYRKYDEGQIQGDFNFIVYAGTSGPRTTEALKQSEIQLFQTLMPVAMKGMIPMEPIIMRLATAFQWKGVDMLMRNYKVPAKQLAAVLLQTQKYMQGDQSVQAPPPQALMEASAATVQAIFTPEELKMLVQELNALAGQQGGGGGGSENPARSAGEPTPPPEMPA